MNDVMYFDTQETAQEIADRLPEFAWMVIEYEVRESIIVGKKWFISVLINGETVTHFTRNDYRKLTGKEP